MDWRPQSGTDADKQGAVNGQQPQETLTMNDTPKMTVEVTPHTF